MSEPDPPLSERLRDVLSRVAEAASEAGRSAEEITTIVVTKFHPSSLIARLAAAGVRDIGESRHQEAREKAAELSGLDLRWHFVGQLQGKKARQVAAYADVIHSVDRPSLVQALSTAEREVECFLQLNLTEDPSRGGVQPEGLLALAEQALSAPRLRLLGVMAVAPMGEDPRGAFARVRAASESLRSLAPDARAISAGMSADFREAVLEGATHLRIGSAITGNRPAAG